ncbi:thiaminase II [uncultured Paludibaculum sp.]|uniref:thiaminase II n=1 Tax=uncultured Paludibaculum sp. TaxID=1765020 RepID=UPI002AAB1E96|nr:thiaminase II [uncultured Paludibaculum sp.]
MTRRTLLLMLAAAPCRAQDFTAQQWSTIGPIYDKTLQHPFLTGLADGTLPRECFQFYLIQDSLYLRAFAQALNVLAAKAPREDWSLTLAQHSIDTIREERRMHQSVLASYGVTSAMVAAADMAPTNVAYTNHLLAAVQRLTFVEGLAAMLPCYWIYWEVGKQLVRRGSSNKDYQRWIDNYAGDEYAATVRQVLAMMNESAGQASPDQRRQALRLFTRSARYEYLFWDMAWRREQWQP